MIRLRDTRLRSKGAKVASALLLVLSATAAADRAPVHLVILHTNDVHGRILPIDYDNSTDVGGVARRATMLTRLGAGRPNVLVVDAGDIWERGPLSKYHGRPEVVAMNAAGYQLMVLGNNEFKAGIPNLQQRIREAQFPVISANVRLKSTGKPLTREYVILRRAGLRIGIFGLTHPRITNYKGMGDLDVDSPIDAAKRMVKLLRPQVDLLIALTHIRFWEDRALAEAVPEIDAIVGGDSHTWIDHPYQVRPESAPGKVIPIVQDGEYGVKQGRLDLWVIPGHKPSPIARFSGELIPVTAKIPESPRVNRAIKRYRAEAGAGKPRARMKPTTVGL